MARAEELGDGEAGDRAAAVPVLKETAAEVVLACSGPRCTRGISALCPTLSWGSPDGASAAAQRALPPGTGRRKGRDASDRSPRPSPPAVENPVASAGRVAVNSAGWNTGRRAGRRGARPPWSWAGRWSALRRHASLNEGWTFCAPRALRAPRLNDRTKIDPAQVDFLITSGACPEIMIRRATTRRRCQVAACRSGVLS